MSSKFCSLCGASIKADANFCHACGARVQKISVTPSESAAGKIPAPPQQIQSAPVNKPSFRTLSKPPYERWVWFLPLFLAFVLKELGHGVLAGVLADVSVLLAFWLLFWAVFGRFKMPMRIVLSTTCLILFVVFLFAVYQWFQYTESRSGSDSWNALIKDLKSRNTTPSPK
jgi:hypothetical protein